MPPVCRSCLWWQRLPSRPAPPEGREPWERAAEAEAGFFGRALVDGDAVIGWMQTAASHLVARAACLPAGPPSHDAYLLTCAYFYDQDYLRGFHFLLQELEASLKHRRVAALEAFALRRAFAGTPFRGYVRERNLFHPEVLEGSGFRAVQARGDVARYRVDLATLVEAPRAIRAREQVETKAAAQPV
jgi:hypothetical protein